MTSNTKQTEDELHAVRQQQALERQAQMGNLATDLKQAKIPPNETIVNTIDSVVQSDTLQEVTDTMSPTGQKVVEDTKKTLISGKDVLLEKNEGEQLQKAVYQGSRAMGMVGGHMKDRLSGEELVSKHFEGTSHLASQAARRVMDLGRLIVTSSEFRRLLRDLQDLAQDALGASISATASDDQDPSEELAGTARDRPDELPGTAREHATDVYQRAHETLQPAVESYSRGDASASEIARDLSSRAGSNVREAGYAAKEHLIDPERRDQLIERLRSVVEEIQAHPDYEAGINELMDLIKEFASRTTAAANTVANAANTATDENSAEIRDARDATRQLVENFCGGRSLQPLSDAFREFGGDVANDDQLSAYVDEVAALLRRSFREPTYVTSNEYTDDANNLFRRGREVFTNNYRGHIDNIWSEMRTLSDAVAQDPTINDFTTNLSELVADLFLDEQGRPTIKFDLIRDFARLLPAIAEKLEYLPIPRIEGSDDDVDYSLDNMVLRCTNLVPRHLYLHTDTTVHMYPPVPYSDRVQSRRDQGELQMVNRVHASLTSIRADARDISFYFKKKTGVARLSDYGTADIVVPDKGISIHLTLVTGDDKADDIRGVVDRTFKIERAEAEVHDMKITMRATKHDLLFKVFNPIITRQAKKAVEKALSERLRALLVKVDEQITIIARQAAETSANINRNVQETAADARRRFREAARRNVQARERTSSSDQFQDGGAVDTDSVRRNEGEFSTTADDFERTGKRAEDYSASDVTTAGSRQTGRTEDSPMTGGFERMGGRTTDSPTAASGGLQQTGRKVKSTGLEREQGVVYEQ